MLACYKSFVVLSSFGANVTWTLTNFDWMDFENIPLKVWAWTLDMSINKSNCAIAQKVYSDFDKVDYVVYPSIEKSTLYKYISPTLYLLSKIGLIIFCERKAT